MSRSRNIKPGFFENADLAELPIYARLLFIGMWTIADREGRLEDRPKQIKFKLMPFDKFDVNKALQDLHSKGFIIRYEVDKNQYIQVVNFLKHQTPHVKEKESLIPAPDMHQTSTVLAPPDSLIPDSLIPDSLIPDSLIPDSKETSSSLSAEEELSTEPEAKMTINEFRKLYSQTFSLLMPAALNQTAHDFCQRHPRDALEQAFIICAEKGAKTFDYFRKVVENKREPLKVDIVKLPVDVKKKLPGRCPLCGCATKPKGIDTQQRECKGCGHVVDTQPIPKPPEWQGQWGGR